MSEQPLASGAGFVRCDLHVHSRPDGANIGDAPDEYIREALERGVRILAITDHNTVDHVQSFLDAAAGTGLVVLPGVELSTNDGHLLAIFAPDAIEDLRRLVGEADIQDAGNGERRTQRSMLDLVKLVGERGGLAIPAHVDAKDGAAGRMRPDELGQLLSLPALAALEFRDVANVGWFSDHDEDEDRRQAWLRRRQNPEFAERGLARVMSSDAHSADRVGVDGGKRVLTRLRLDEPNFNAIRNALLWNPEGRCRIEAELPETYPRILTASFEGGLLDGVEIAFSNNLTAIIGGRGSGKSTTLLAIRAALGCPVRDEDPDEEGRMPERTRVRFVDLFGTTRTAVREREGRAVDEETGDPIDLPLADLGQDESGRIARGYKNDPGELLRFLEGFCDLREWDEREATLLERLEASEGEVVSSRPDLARKTNLEQEVASLQRKLATATSVNVEAIAKYAAILAAEDPLLDAIDQAFLQLERAPQISVPNLDSLATTFTVDLTERPASDHADDLRSALAQLSAAAGKAKSEYQTAMQAAVAPSRALLDSWRTKHAEWKGRADQKRAELKAAGLEVQAGELERIGQRMAQCRTEMNEIKDRELAHKTAVKSRARLVAELHENREQRRRARKKAIRVLYEAVNEHSDGPTTHIRFEDAALLSRWIEWLRANLNLRSPRVERAAAELRPLALVEVIREQGVDGLGALRLHDGRALVEPDNVLEAFHAIGQFETQFELETMLLDDRPVIEVREAGGGEPRAFDRHSTGEQRSILLSLILCAGQGEPLMLDQPEDHLDARYIASRVVRHLERVKERRQVIIATHSANLTVLGDAELVHPMFAADGRAAPRDTGAVDHATTRDRVCELLEGGEAAYRRRGRRYGISFSDDPVR